MKPRRKPLRKLLTFAKIRSQRQTPMGRWAAHPRTQLALRMLKRIKVKGGRAGRLCVAPSYARQLGLFLSA